MGKFLSCLSFDDCGDEDGKWARLTKPLTYVADEGTAYWVPMGFCTDFASIPGLLQSLVGSPTGGKYRRAAVLHDYLYETGMVSREIADGLFHEAMLASGVGTFRAWQLWAGVRAGGGRYYRASGGENG